MRTAAERSRDFRAKNPEYWNEYYGEKKEHIQKKKKEYRHTMNGKLKSKAYMLKWKHGVSLEAFNLLKCLQRHKCAICGGPSNGMGDFHVDHDHDTGKIRGLLCHKCNLGIGLLGDNLNKAQEYLTNPVLC